MAKYVLTESDIEKVTYSPEARNYPKKPKAIYGAFSRRIEGEYNFKSKSFNIEIIQYTPEEIADVPLKTIIKGIFIKMGKQLFEINRGLKRSMYGGK